MIGKLDGDAWLTRGGAINLPYYCRIKWTLAG